MPISNGPTLSSLPVELKLSIIKFLPNTTDLKALIHASSAYHQSYLLAREEIFTLLTFRTLRERGIDILGPACGLGVTFRDGIESPVEDFKHTINPLWKKMKCGGVQRVRLSIEGCKLLLQIDKCVRFYRELGERSKIPVIKSTRPCNEVWDPWQKRFLAINIDSDESEYRDLIDYIRSIS
ncbi:MAG: hypothetical protein Q9191_008021 [Dirinaria sp. TL-2023a]